MTTIENKDRLSNKQYHRQGSAKWWWLRAVDGDFIKIGSHRGDKDLELELDLEPGIYVLGVGRGDDAIRETIVVEEPAEVLPARKRLAAITDEIGLQETLRVLAGLVANNVEDLDKAVELRARLNTIALELNPHSS